MSTKQHALAAEIRAEAAAQRITAKDLQRAVGVSSSAWSNYFVACTRDVPIGVVVSVAEALGMTGSELLRRAEDRFTGSLDAPADTLGEHITRQLSPEAQAAVREARAVVSEGTRRAQPNG